MSHLKQGGGEHLSDKDSAHENATIVDEETEFPGLTFEATSVDEANRASMSTKKKKRGKNAGKNKDPSYALVNSKYSEFRNKKERRRAENKKRREEGKEYFGEKVTDDGIKFVKREKRKLGPACTSKRCKQSPAKRCCFHFTEEIRMKIFTEFWLLLWEERKIYVQSHVDISAPRKISNVSKHKEKSMQYHLDINNKRKQVCKSTFLNTLGIKGATLIAWLAKKTPLNQQQLECDPAVDEDECNQPSLTEFSGDEAEVSSQNHHRDADVTPQQSDQTTDKQTDICETAPCDVVTAAATVTATAWSDLSQLCRMCGDPRGISACPLTSGTQYNGTLREAVTKYFGITVTKQGVLPVHVCSGCCDAIYRWTSLVTKVFSVQAFYSEELERRGLPAECNPFFEIQPETSGASHADQTYNESFENVQCDSYNRDVNTEYPETYTSNTLECEQPEYNSRIMKTEPDFNEIFQDQQHTGQNLNLFRPEPMVLETEQTFTASCSLDPTEESQLETPSFTESYSSDSDDDDPSFKLPYCSNQDTNISGPPAQGNQRHLRNTRSSLKISKMPCTHCKACFVKYKKVITHQKKHISKPKVKKFLFQCDECKRHLKTKITLIKHLKLHDN